MKSLNTLLTVFLAILLSVSSVSAQYVTVGTATGTNTTTAQSPINIYFRSLHYQVVYTVTELQAAGFTPAAAIQQLGWNVTATSLYAMPNYTIRMGHTTNSSSTVATYIPSSTLTQVFNTPSYQPTAGGFDMLSLSTPFIWNGTDNLVIDVCFDQVNPTYNASGQVSTYTATNGSTSIRSDGSSQCGLTVNAVHAYKPVVQFLLLTGAAPTCSMVNNDLAASNVTAYTADLTWTHPGTPVSYIVEYGPSGFVPGTGTTITPTASPALLTSLNPAVPYTARVRAVCGTAVGDTSYARAVNFVTPCATFMAPHTETFGTGVTPLCWAQSQPSATYQWKFSGVTAYQSYGLPIPTSHTPDGSSFTWVDGSYLNATYPNTILTMNEVDISNLPSAALSFWFYSNATYTTAAANTGANNLLVVEASDGAGGWDTVTVIQQDLYDWQFKLYDLAPYAYGAGLVQIRFNAQKSPTGTTFFYNDLLLDDVKIAAMPTSACAPVTAPDTMGFEDAGALNACWEQDTLDNMNWIIGGPGGTPSSATGPSGANSGTYYAYIESSSPASPGDSAILMSPPINTALLEDAPAMYFNYHMRGNDYMRLRAEYEVFGSESWTTLWEQEGAVQTLDTDPYEEVYIPMPDVIGALIRVRFIAIVGANDGVSTGAGTGFSSDIAIDDIRIQNVLADDVAVTEILTPGNACGLGVEPITIEVTNRGFNAQTGVAVFVSINGGTPVGYTVNGTIAGNGGVATVTVLADLSALGEHSIEAYTVLAEDEVVGNDSKTETAYHQTSVAGQYDETFEMSNGTWYGTGDWEYGMPTGTVINGAGSGDNAYVTVLNGNYADNKMSYLYSPCFDISTMLTPVLRFSINWDLEDDWDGAWLEYSVDGGTSWSKLGANNFAGLNWYTDSISNNPYGWVWNGTGANGSGGWIDAIIDLQPYGLTVGTNLNFRFVMAADASTSNEGVGIDNFGIYDGCLSVIMNETIVDETVDGLSNGSVTVSPVGGFGGYTYLWSNGSTSSSITGLAPGTYSVTVSDQASCVTTGTFTVGSLCPASLGLTTSSNPEIGDGEANGAAFVAASAGTAPYTYAWSNGVNTNQSLDLTKGDYTVVVTDAAGCVDTAMVTISTVYLVGTENLEGLTGLLLSPNPAKDFAQLNINFDRAVDLTVKLVDVTGRVLETRNAGNTTSEMMRFDVSTLAEGVYFMQITANGQTATQRFVVVK